MKLFNLFRTPPKSANIAKERLKIIVAHDHERTNRCSGDDFLPKLQKELIEVISKYVAVDQDAIKVAMDHTGERSTLELNITLPEKNAALLSTETPATAE